MLRKNQTPSIFQEIHLRENLIKIIQFFLTLIAMIGVYSTFFHYIMLSEGKSFSWLTGVYWTLTTMSTLGYGDITFDSDAGKFFSVWVLMSGLVYLLIMLPYVFITLFYTPWSEFQTKHRLYFFDPSSKKKHVIIVGLDLVAEALIDKLISYKIEYVLIANTIELARSWKAKGYYAIFGHFDDPNSYERAKIHNAKLVFANGGDGKFNTSISLTVRGIDSEIEIVSDVINRDFHDILFLAGCNSTIDITETLGRSFSRRSVANGHFVSTIGKFNKLIVWEVPAYGAKFLGKTIGHAVNLLQGLYVVGVWNRGKFIIPELDETITPGMILVVTGFIENAGCLDTLYQRDFFENKHVLIIGCGRVGRSTAHFLQRLGVEFKILDNVPEREKTAKEEGILTEGRFVLGDGARADDLERAGLQNASTVIVSTHDDPVNTFLTLYCRKLQSDILILSRANLERNISSLHRAGADLVISYASTGAMLIFNLLEKSNNIMLEEGLELFRIPIPSTLKGKTIASENIRRKTGCSIIAVCQGSDITSFPSIHEPLPKEESEIILIGSPEAERAFIQIYAR